MEENFDHGLHFSFGRKTSTGTFWVPARMFGWAENTVKFWVKVEILGIFWVNGKIFGWEKILRSQRQHFGLHKKT